MGKKKPLAEKESASPLLYVPSQVTNVRHTKRTPAFCLQCALCIVAVFVGVLLALFVYQYYAVQRDAIRFPARGNRFLVEGRNMHLWCIGAQTNPSSTFLFESGFAFSSLAWVPLFEQIEKDSQLTQRYRFCAYDRQGYGWSDAPTTKRNVTIINEELYSLLKVSGVSPPYVLVGWSFGGNLIHLFAHDRPEDVSGMIVVDSELSYDDLGSALTTGLISFRIASLLSPFGFLRIGGEFDALPMESGAPSSVLPSHLREETFAQMATYKFPRTCFHELSHWDELGNAMAALQSLTEDELQRTRHIAVTVLTATKPEPHCEKCNDQPKPKLCEEGTAAIRSSEAQFYLQRYNQERIHSCFVDSDHYIPSHCPSSILVAIRDLPLSPSI